MPIHRPKRLQRRIVLGFALGPLVALLVLVGYRPAGQPADAMYQPQPTSIAFVPLYPAQLEAPGQAERDSEAAEATRQAEMMARLYAEGQDQRAEADMAPPEPAAAQIAAQDDECSFPCVPEVPADEPIEPVTMLETGEEAPEALAEAESPAENPETE